LQQWIGCMASTFHFLPRLGFRLTIFDPLKAQTMAWHGMTQMEKGNCLHTTISIIFRPIWCVGVMKWHNLQKRKSWLLSAICA
jgi:uncharacterized membrane protein YagU involved in acid resistance